MELSQAMKDVVAVLMAIIGVAILAVLLQSRNTTSVIQASTGGFSDMLKTAMGNI